MEPAQAAQGTTGSPMATPISTADSGPSAASAAAAVQGGSEKTEYQKQEESKQLGEYIRRKGACVNVFLTASVGNVIGTYNGLDVQEITGLNRFPLANDLGDLIPAVFLTNNAGNELIVHSVWRRGFTFRCLLLLIVGLHKW